MPVAVQQKSALQLELMRAISSPTPSVTSMEQAEVSALPGIQQWLLPTQLMKNAQPSSLLRLLMSCIKKFSKLDNSHSNSKLLAAPHPEMAVLHE
jgi:hypothetical protein